VDETAQMATQQSMGSKPGKRAIILIIGQFLIAT
jgi:hypothetical protein